MSASLEKQLNDQGVESWLAEHPDFFIGRDELLEKLKIPHTDARHGSISLLERQLTIARNRIKSLDDRLQSLIAAARDTEIQYRQLRALILALLESDSVDDLLQALSSQLNEQLNIPDMALWRTTDPSETLSMPLYALGEGEQALFKQLLKGKHCCCTLLTDEQYRHLLPQTKGLPQEEEPPSSLSASGQASPASGATPKGSAAITRVAIGHHTGVFVLASPSPTRFNASLDTLFIDYLGEVVGRLLHVLTPR